jgi:type II secretory pathway component PulM
MQTWWWASTAQENSDHFEKHLENDQRSSNHVENNCNLQQARSPFRNVVEWLETLNRNLLKIETISIRSKEKMLGSVDV